MSAKPHSKNYRTHRFFKNKVIMPKTPCFHTFLAYIYPVVIQLIIIILNCSPDPRYRSSSYRQSYYNEERPIQQTVVTDAGREQGLASFMSDELQGKKTANGELFNKWALAAAHKTLPFGTIVRVTNLENQKTVDVRINDRGPFVAGRIIDVTYEAARQLDFIQQGLTRVEIQVIKAAGKQ